MTVVAAVAAAVWGLWSWLTPSPDLCDRLRDDAFYEFAWAANVAAGNGATVSDGVTTSGVQWLWSLLLVPVAWLGGAAMLPVLAPWIGLALHVATAGLWLRATRDRVGGFCLAMCWLGHPLLLREAQNGQETALACFLTLALVLSRYAGERRFVALGVLAALARTELLAVVFTLSMCRNVDRPVRGLRAVLIASVLPFTLNLWLGGGLLPDSAAPMSWLWHENFAAIDDSWSGYLAQQWWYTRPALLGGPFAMASVFGFGWLLFRLVRPFWPKSLRVVPAVVVGVASALGVHDLATPGWAALLLVLFPASSRRRIPLSLLCVVVGLSVIVVLNWPLRWYPRDYYLAPLVVAAFYGFLRCSRFRVALLALAVVQVQDGWRVQPEPLSAQDEMRLAASFLNEAVPAGERVGCFNSGIVTFFGSLEAPDRQRRNPVVNLDGVVDARSFAALQQSRLAAHLDELGVRFVLDNPVQFSLDPRRDHACGRYFGDGFDPDRDLVELARFDVPDVGDSMRLYWRAGRGEQPAPMVAAGIIEVSTDVVRWGARAGERLERRDDDGNWRELAAADVDTVVVLRAGAYPRDRYRIASD